MTDTRSVWVCVYSVRGWQERVQVHSGRAFSPFGDNWLPAGTLAAGVLGWPSRRPAIEPWAQRISDEKVWREVVRRLWSKDGPATDTDVAVDRAILRRMELGDERRLLTILGLKGSLAPAQQRRLKDARTFAERYPEARQGLVSWPASWVLITPDIGGEVVSAFGRDEQHFITTPAAAVNLSAVVGFARRTLTLCGWCAQFVAFPREGYERKHCDRCRDLRESRFPVKGRAADLAADKLARWERVSARVYRRLLPRRATIGRLRKKQQMSPEGRARWDEWNLLAWNALLVATDLDAWEAAWAPKQKRGPKLGGGNGR